MGTPEPPALRRNRDFARLWVGQAVSTLGWRTSFVAYPLLALELTGSPAAAGLLAFANWAPLLAVGLPAGALVDRWSRRRVLVACDGARAVALASVAAAAAAGALTYVHLLAVAVVEGTLTALFRPALSAALVRVVPQPQLARALARNEARDAAAAVAGPPLGGALLGVARAAPFVLDALSYLVSLAAVATLRSPLDAPVPVARHRLLREVAEAVRWLWRRPFLRTSLVLVGAGNLISNAVGLLIILVAHAEGASPSAVGAMLAVVAAGGLAGAVASGWLQSRMSARQVVVAHPWLHAVLLPLLAVVRPPLALGAVVAAMLMLGPTWNAVVGSIQLSLVPDGLQGRVSAIDWFVSGCGTALGPPLCGVLFSGVGASAAALLLTALAGALALTALVSRSLRELPLS